MHIIVCIKQVPGTMKVEVDPKTGVLQREGIAHKLNPYDLFALETALRLKEAIGARLTVISMGPQQAMSVIREAYWMGVDAGVLLSDRRFGGADVLATAYTLAQGIQTLAAADLVLCGKQTTDGDTAQVGPELAHWLGMPNLCNVVEIKAGEQDAEVKIDLNQIIQTVRIKYPCLLSVEKDIYVPRLPSYRLKKATAPRTVKVLTLDDLEDRDARHYGLTGSATQVERIFPPQAEGEHQILRDNGHNLAVAAMEKLRQHKLL
ncbi:MAG: electron transfer flavoprotein subunit beta/FixA family protein [Negativicutes bacterium]|nr:electron transfer flavoprotein subunit beta/FixA family protein [Negativicutes bacterium]